MREIRNARTIKRVIEENLNSISFIRKLKRSFRNETESFFYNEL